ncbi:MAG TPA: 50S ribosomal protein L9 [Alphaproteobacteria bacterium]|jgi:large subunit ribosomal protein L9
MQVILLERVEHLGQMGDMVDVKPGYARNYLLPQGKALRATDENRKRFESRRGQLEATNLERRKEAEAVVGRVDKLVLPIIRQASEGDQLYGSVTARDIHEALAAAGVKVNRQQVLLERTIKAVGLHKVRVALHPEVIVEITANVGRSDAELEIQARGERPADVAARQAEQEEALAASEVFESGEAPPEIAGADAAEPEAAEAAAAEAPAERRRPARRPRE